jgi:hypothetical protein
LQEWNYFLRGDAGVLEAGSPPASWLTSVAWNNVCFLDANIPSLQGLKASIEQDAGWQRWYGAEAPEQVPYPGGAKSSAELVTWISSKSLGYALESGFVPELFPLTRIK